MRPLKIDLGLLIFSIPADSLLFVLVPCDLLCAYSVSDPNGLIDSWEDRAVELECPSCQSKFARDAQIHGRPALKMVGGKVRMRK